MLDWFRRTVRNLGQNAGWVLVGVVVVIILAVFFLREGSGVDTDVLQVTIDAASTQANAYIPTVESNMTLTPVDAVLTGAAPTLSLAGRHQVDQFAASASASSELDSLTRGAVQATGPVNTTECGDFYTAWASVRSNEVATLTVLFAELVTPTGILIYESYNPGFVVKVEFTDLYGETHTVYDSPPQPRLQCPFVMVIPIIDADYQGNRVTITVDQTASLGGWDQIDAVELIGIRH
jgi:hypothetical protein